MPPRIQVRSHSLAFRPRVQRPFTQQLWQSRRTYADEGKQSEQGLHPNPNVQAHTDPAAQSQQAVNEKEDDPRAGALPHVSEEAAAMAKSMGTQPPELEKGTPVAEVCDFFGVALAVWWRCASKPSTDYFCTGPEE